jgi:hypothetical protein
MQFFEPLNDSAWRGPRVAVIDSAIGDANKCDRLDKEAAAS